MSTFMLIIIGYGLLSIFCTAVLVASCVIAGRAKRFRTSAKFRSVLPSPILAEMTAKKLPTAATGQRVVEVASPQVPALVNQ